MYVTLRQGIIKAPATYLNYQNGVVSINTMNSSISATASHGAAEYLITEARKSTTKQAWLGPFTHTQTYWLFWDIDVRTAQITYVMTSVLPKYQTLAPSQPLLNEHWFNLHDNIMRVYNGTLWVEKIRVYAGCIINNTTLQLAAVGTSHSSNNVPYKSGVILFDTNGTPVRKNLKEFLTTEDPLMYDSINLSTTNIEAKTIWAPVVENVDVYSVVSTLSNGSFKLADAEDVGVTNIGMAMDSAILGNHISVTLQGKVTNPEWNWPVINQLLWVDIDGQLINVDPSTINSTRPSKSPVARVLSNDSIVFMPSLADVNTTTISQQATSVAYATDVVYGISKLSYPAAYAGNPIVVGTNDPRMTNARTPLPHHHNASDISAYGSVPNSDVQFELNNLYDVKLGLTGGTMTGPLYLNESPINPQEAATKQYVDNAITGLSFKEAVDVASTGSIAIMSGLLMVDGYQTIANDRVLVKDQINPVNNGIYIVKPLAWTRALDADENYELEAGSFVFVLKGITNTQTGWVLTTETPVVGTTPLNFVQFSGQGQIIAGNGIIKTGNSIAVKTTSNNRIVSTVSGIDLVASGVTAGTYNNVTVDTYGRITAGSTTAYLTNNESIVFTGDITGSGTTNVLLTLPNVVTPGTYTSVTVDAKGRVTSGTNIPSTGGSELSVQYRVVTQSNNADQIIDTFDVNQYRSVKYQMQITTGVEYHCVDIQILHNGTSAKLVEYGTILTGSYLATFDTEVVNGFCHLLVSPSTSNTTTFKFIATYIED